MRMLLVSVAALAVAAAMPVQAQANPHDGQWTAYFKIGNGTNIQARVVLQGQGGSWQNIGLPAGADICARIQAPIEVLAVSDSELSLVVRRAQALAGCTDGQPLTLKRADDGSLQGVTVNGTPITLRR